MTPTFMPVFSVGPIFISFPVSFFGGDKKFTRLSHRGTHWIQYRGDFGFIRLDPPWAPGALLPQVRDRVRALCKLDILGDGVSVLPDDFLLDGFRIHDMSLWFDFPHGRVFECRRPHFYLVKNRVYLSADYKVKRRGDGTVKETQYSLLRYEPMSELGRAGPWRLSVRISGKYRNMLDWHDLGDPSGLSDQFWYRLSLRITQVVDPTTFFINDSYRQFLSPWFWDLFASGGWFINEKFYKRRFRDKGGVPLFLDLVEETPYAV